MAQTHLCITAGEEGTVLLICCTTDLVEGVPGAEDDQKCIGIQAYSALKKKKAAAGQRVYIQHGPSC